MITDKRLVKEIWKDFDEDEKKILGMVANDMKAVEIFETGKTRYTLRSLEQKLGEIRKRFRCQTNAGLLALLFRNKLIK